MLITDNSVKLDVGGTIFKTTKSTLTKFDGFFKTMLESDIPIKKDENGCIVIDRDPTHFRYILNFLRNGKIEFPASSEELKEIQEEAQYYVLIPLVNLCASEMKKSQEADFMLNKYIRFIKNDGELLQVMGRISLKPALIIYYHVDGFGGTIRPAGFYIYNLLSQYKNKLDVFFKSYHNRDENAASEPVTYCWHWSLHYSRAHRYDVPKMKVYTDRRGYTDTSFTLQLEQSIKAFFAEQSLVL